MTYADLDRPPLSAASLRRALRPDGWDIEVLEETGSTNQVVAQRAREGAAAGLVVIAERQTAGRGRLDRAWLSPPRAGLTMSVLVRPDLPVERFGWLPLWTGLAVATAVRDAAELPATLKWPNDVLVGGRKVCGVLAEAVDSSGAGDSAAVLGIGVNVTTTPDELPVSNATSLRVAGATMTDRGTLLRVLLRALGRALADPDAACAQYRELCGTVGQQVRVELPGGAWAQGTADQVDDSGRLVVDGTPYSAGDVVHLRA